MDPLNDILQRVSRPGRYTGGEWHHARGDWDAATLHFALAYPDVYEIGMSSLTVPILYDCLNAQPEVIAERVFTPGTDMTAEMRRVGLPLFSLESRRPLADFDVIGFSLSYELSYTNLLEMLDLAGLPLRTAARSEGQPLVIAGGSCVLNPEPVADFIDLFVLGDGEAVLPELTALLVDWLKNSKPGGRAGLFLRAAQVEGVYVPSLYRVSYHDDGRISEVTPQAAGVPPRPKRRVVAELPPAVTAPVVPFIQTVHDRGAVEIQRGCSRGCRVCHAGITYRPVRERSHDEVTAAVGEIISECGYDEISLLSLCTSDYGGIKELVARLVETYPEIAISLPSLRLDSASVELVDSLPSRRRSGLTYAPEAGSDRLRAVINKPVSDEDVLKTAATAFERGWTGLKLYFMLGLPTETDADIQAIVTLVRRVQQQGRRPQLRVSVSTFVPKPHTPFQWSAQAAPEEIARKQTLLRTEMPRKGIKLSWTDPQTSLLEAMLARGDRRLSDVIEHAWRDGAVMDAWSESFDYSRWRRALESCGLNLEFYTGRERALDEVLPWGHLDCGVSTAYLKREYRRAAEARTTVDCRTDNCQACGLEDSVSACALKLNPD